MAHQIILTKNHKRILLEVLNESLIIKQKRLQKADSIKRMENEYINAGEKIYSDYVECGRLGSRAGDNLFGWYRDQILHSGKLSETEIGQLALSICEAAGTNRYDQFCKMTIINTLFE